jgi:PAS domain S-box-containing protein
MRHLINGPEYADYSLAWVDPEEVSQLGVWRWDLTSGRIELSERVRGIFGLSDPHGINTLPDLIQIVHPEDRRRVLDELELATVQGRPFSWEARIIRSDGGERTVLSTGSPTEMTGTTVAEMVGVCRDVSAKVVAAESTAGQLERRLQDIIAKAPAMISIKDLNLRYRMAHQDIAALAGRPLDQIIGRTATELFPSVGPQVDAAAVEALATLETVHSDVQFDVCGQVRTFNLVTFALTDRDGAPVEICCVANDVTERRQHQEQTRLRRDATELIGSALVEDRMVAVRQPVLDITGERTVSEELLVRLSLPHQAGLLQPGAFLPLAERFGLIQGIDIWMVNRGLWVALDRPVQVNLSAITLTDSRARETIIEKLQSVPDAASRVVFEITETAAAHHLDAACEFAAALTEFGCGLALDDFGTGFGSFTYLRRLPLRYLKIDRSFVTGLANSLDDRRVVSSIIGIAKQFELWTIAEGVEDAATLEILGQLGADFAQGFYLGRPGPL